MKFKLVFFFFIFLLTDSKSESFEDKYGIGIIIVNCIPKDDYQKDKYTVDLFDTIANNAEPIRTYILHFSVDDSLFKELNYKRIDFNGELLMLCVERIGDWYKVRIKGNQEYWTKNSKLSFPGWNGKPTIKDNYAFFSWEQFIAKTIWVSRLDKESNPIRKQPNEKSVTIKFDAGECLTAVDAKGIWLKITPQNGEGCFDDNVYDDAIYQKKYFKYGWIRWRDENNFLINVRNEK